ncbi:hypothetical protein ACEPT2_32280, partial [Burkholderia pseudomallei]
MISSLFFDRQYRTLVAPAKTMPDREIGRFSCVRRADVRRDSRFGGLAARFRRIAVSPIRHVADSTPAVRRARN